MKSNNKHCTKVLERLSSTQLNNQKLYESKRIHECCIYKFNHCIKVVLTSDKSNNCATYVHLEGGDALAVLGGHGGGLDDLDRLVAGSVATSHVVICGEMGGRVCNLRLISWMGSAM